MPAILYVPSRGCPCDLQDAGFYSSRSAVCRVLQHLGGSHCTRNCAQDIRSDPWRRVATSCPNNTNQHELGRGGIPTTQDRHGPLSDPMGGIPIPPWQSSSAPAGGCHPGNPLCAGRANQEVELPRSRIRLAPVSCSGTGRPRFDRARFQAVCRSSRQGAGQGADRPGSVPGRVPIDQTGCRSTRQTAGQGAEELRQSFRSALPNQSGREEDDDAEGFRSPLHLLVQG
jgi:hypothetical protein